MSCMSAGLSKKTSGLEGEAQGAGGQDLEVAGSAGNESISAMQGDVLIDASGGACAIGGGRGVEGSVSAPVSAYSSPIVMREEAQERARERRDAKQLQVGKRTCLQISVLFVACLRTDGVWVSESVSAVQAKCSKHNMCVCVCVCVCV